MSRPLHEVGGPDDYRDEPCWACQGYGTVHGPLDPATNTRPVWYCPWCRGTAQLYDGAHEVGQACDCCRGRDFRPGDDWFDLMGYEIAGYLRARLPRDPVLRARIEAELTKEREGDD